MLPRLLIVLLLSLPAPAAADVLYVEITNPSVYTAVFLVDTTSDTVTWLSGLDGPGAATFWTPGAPRVLSVSSNPVPVDFPDDPAALRQLFIDPDFTAGPSDQFFLGYPSSAGGMVWNEGSSVIPSNHACNETSGCFLSMPVAGFQSQSAFYSSNMGGFADLNPGWSVNVSATSPVPATGPVGAAALALALLACVRRASARLARA